MKGMKMCTLEDYKLLKTKGSDESWGVEHELDSWHRWYLPVGDTVLDIGASYGDTALFYLLHGAKRIICLEQKGKNMELLKQNRKILLKKFPYAKIDIIEAHVDKIKIDVEGSEKNLAIETHFPHRFKRHAINIREWLIGQIDGEYVYTLEERKSPFAWIGKAYHNSWVKLI